MTHINRYLITSILLTLILCATGCYNRQETALQEDKTTPVPYVKSTLTIEVQISPTPPIESTGLSPTPRENITPTPIYTPTIEYELTVPEGYLAYASYDDEIGEYKINLHNIVGKTVNCITCRYNNIISPRQPTWSPDGSYLAFTAFHKDDNSLVRRIWMMNSDGSQLVDLTGDTADASYPRWSPDGKYLTYSLGNRYQSEICMVHVISKESKCLTHNSNYDGDAVWSPDGQRIAFVSSGDLSDGLQLYTMKPDGTDLQLLSDRVGRVGYLEWSPDGRSIAFTLAPTEGGEAGKIHILDLGTEKLQRLTDSDTQLAEEYPSWSPDGQYIAFANTAARTSQIVIVHVNSRQWIEITPLGVPNDNTTPVWLANDAHINHLTSWPEN